MCNENEQFLAEESAMFQYEFINKEFSESEVRNVIKQLKCNKAAGTDPVVNEFLRVTADKLCPMFTKLFNVILVSGVIPEAWSQGLIVPIYKKKCEVTDPNNYRGMSLLSCIGILFTSLISQRISQYVEHCELLGAEQAGFWKGFSIMDHLFVFNNLIQLHVHTV